MLQADRPLVLLRLLSVVIIMASVCSGSILDNFPSQNRYWQQVGGGPPILGYTYLPKSSQPAPYPLVQSWQEEMRQKEHRVSSLWDIQCRPRQQPAQLPWWQPPPAFNHILSEFNYECLGGGRFFNINFYTEPPDPLILNTQSDIKNYSLEGEGTDPFFMYKAGHVANGSPDAKPLVCGDNKNSAFIHFTKCSEPLSQSAQNEIVNRILTASMLKDYQNGMIVVDYGVDKFCEVYTDMVKDDDSLSLAPSAQPRHDIGSYVQFEVQAQLKCFLYPAELPLYSYKNYYYAVGYISKTTNMIMGLTERIKFEM